MPAKISHSHLVRSRSLRGIESRWNMGTKRHVPSPSGPLFLEFVSSVLQDGFPVAEASHVEIECGQLFQTTFPFIEIFIPQAPSQSHHVAARVGGEEHASVLRP